MIVTDSVTWTRMTPRSSAESLYRFFHAGDEETLALQGVSLTVEAARWSPSPGRRGPASSTLLACLAGLDEPDGGTVRVGGERMTRRSEERTGAAAGAHASGCCSRAPT